MPNSHVHLSTPVESIITRDEGTNHRVELTTASGSIHYYDHVIMACHSDEALDIIRRGGVSPTEERILSKYRWNQNQIALHCDPTVTPCISVLSLFTDSLTQLMPRNRLAWSCWNYLTTPTCQHAKSMLLKNGSNEFAL